MKEFLSDAVGVRDISGKGLGLVTVRPVQIGELLFVSKSVTVASVEQIALETLRIVQGISPESVAARRLVLSLDDGFQKRASSAIKADWFHPEKRFLDLGAWSDARIDLSRVQHVIRRNAHIVTDMMEEGAIGGGVHAAGASSGTLVALWPLLSLINHDCAPTVACVPVDQETIACVAATSLAAEAELTDSYINPLQSHAERQQELSEQKGFECKCKRCLLEVTELPDSVSSAISVRVQEAHGLATADAFLHAFLKSAAMWVRACSWQRSRDHCWQSLQRATMLAQFVFC
eukprot:TRINITY_DN29447_c0_g1_i1.p1 TRINITY_DN29447_c0_g1~~TRINITY_DN29447_c0_g1_i1.p1  ORF type:complete len:302 (-),score=43.82 TRINITY_DN29447_c0_g1_i1:1017-1886(-)